MNESRAEPHLVRVPAGTLAAVQRVLASDVADAAAAADMVRRIGLEAGGDVFDLLRQRVSGFVGAVQDIESAEFWTRLDAFFRDLGWGGVEHERLHPGVVALVSGDWFESASSTSAEPACHFTVGMLGELFRRIAGAELAVLEVRCRAAGDGECRFLVGSPAALEDVYGRVAGGAHYREAVAGLPQ